MNSLVPQWCRLKNAVENNDINQQIMVEAAAI